MTKYIIING